MTARPESPAAERNKAAILEVIRSEFAGCRSVLEIGSGTGQHAAFFAGQMPWLVWQTSDRAENLAGIRAWVEYAACTNLRDPLTLDVLEDHLAGSRYDAAFSANTAHIMHPEAVAAMFSVVAGVLGPGGRFCLYGPFNLDGKFTSDSNRQFHESLQRRDPGMGIRDLEDLDRLAAGCGLQRTGLYAMPANNMLAVWVKNGTDGNTN